MAHPHFPVTHKQILLVDDSPAQCELLVQALAQHGLTELIHIESSADSALGFLSRQVQSDDPRLPTLILIDLKLSRSTGIELVRLLRSDPRFACLPVVMFTTSDDPNDIVASYTSGANGYVVKPHTFSDLVELTGAVSSFWLDWNRTSEPC